MGDNPTSMFLTSVTLVCALFALLFFAFAMHRWRRGRVLAGTGHLLAAIVLGFGAVCVALFGTTLMTYERLTHEQPAVEVTLKRSGDRHYQARLTYPSTLTQDFELLGDEWQVDARMLKWKGLAHWLGFDTVYRLERIGGRYTDVAMEKTAPRTVRATHPPSASPAWTSLPTIPSG